MKYSYAFVVMPGGFGTLDEYFEALTLIQTKMVEQFPIIIFDRAFHKDVMDHIDLMVSKGTISEDDLKLCLFTDSIEEAVKHLQEYSINKFGLKPSGITRPHWWMLESRVKNRLN